MIRKIVFFILQFGVFCNQYQFIYGNPIVGYDIRSVPDNEYTFVVALVYTDSSAARDESIMCTGFVISRFNVITGAHCFDAAEETGFGILSDSHVLCNSILYHPNWWITYDQWAQISNVVPQHGLNDIAIIRLIQSVGSHIVPATISQNSRYTELYGQDAVMLGWGLSNTGLTPETLLAADVKIITHAECSAIATGMRMGRVRVPTRYICTRAEELALLRSGDCGGPLLYQGRVIGFHKGVFPTDDTDCENAVNFHIGIHHYLDFLADCDNM